MNRHSLATFIRSRLFLGLMLGIGLALAVIVIFEVGVAVGYHEAIFSSHWGENYESNFGDDHESTLFIGDDHGPMANGAVGEVVRVSSSTLIIADPDASEQRVLIDSGTIIRDHESAVTVSELTPGTHVVVVGVPTDDGVIDAKLIRIVPASTGSSSPAQP